MFVKLLYFFLKLFSVFVYFIPFLSLIYGTSNFIIWLFYAIQLKIDIHSFICLLIQTYLFETFSSSSQTALRTNTFVYK